MTPGSGRSTGEGIGYPLQYTWPSFVAQQVNNPPAMQETWVLSLDWEDPLEKKNGTQSSILGLENSNGCKESNMIEQLSWQIIVSIFFLHLHQYLVEKRYIS